MYLLKKRLFSQFTTVIFDFLSCIDSSISDLLDLCIVWTVFLLLPILLLEQILFTLHYCQQYSTVKKDIWPFTVRNESSRKRHHCYCVTMYFKQWRDFFHFTDRADTSTNQSYLFFLLHLCIAIKTEVLILLLFTCATTHALFFVLSFLYYFCQ